MHCFNYKISHSYNHTQPSNKKLRVHKQLPIHRLLHHDIDLVNQWTVSPRTHAPLLPMN